MARLVGIAGGSGGGKTTLAELIQRHLAFWDLKCFILSTDNCYRDLSHLTPPERDDLCFNPERNYDHPSLLDFEKLVGYAEKLKEGEQFEVPRYDFKIHGYGQEVIPVPPHLDVAIVEGIYALYSGPEVGKDLVSLYDFSIFVTTDPLIAQCRRILRDFEERGRAPSHIVRQLIRTVIPMQRQYIDPTQLNAKDVVNWRADETKNPDEVKKELLHIARQKAAFIYEYAMGKPLLPDLDPERVVIKGL